MTQPRRISLQGVRVHNLQGIDLEIPHGLLVTLCGVSGSGKSSLAFDTLYAEGQRRYIETFSAYTRQFLERLEKPDADRIDGIPAAIAVATAQPPRSTRSTVGTATEANDYLRLLFAKIGRVVCTNCGREVRRDTPQSAADELSSLPAGVRFLISFGVPLSADTDRSAISAELQSDGFQRAIVDGQTVRLTEHALDSQTPTDERAYVIVDRLAAGGATPQRLRESLETAFAKGNGTAYALIEAADQNALEANGAVLEIDGQPWRRLTWSRDLKCGDCGREYPTPEPRLYSFNSPLGACPVCEGYGNILDIDMELVVPDRQKSLREGAIVPWTTPAYAHELEELLALAADYHLPVDVPFAELGPEHLRLIQEGVPERNFGGLRGFFAWLERHKYKVQVRVFLSRWKSQRRCPACGGARLRPEALATRVGGRNIAELADMQVSDLLEFFRRFEPTTWERTVGRMMLDQVQSRLGYLEAVGLGYLTLDRPLRTLSGGEAQRVALTSALGSSLVNMLYVLDEPSVGLHPHDTDRLTQAVLGLRNRGNTVVVVEHEEALIRAADQVIEIGPGAGDRGGKVVFQGTPAEIVAAGGSLTGDYLAGRRQIRPPAERRAPARGTIRLTGARGHNLQNVTVEFPLGLLCLVTGVSGSGKSTLIENTLYPALCRRLRKESPQSQPYDDVFGDGQINDAMLVDQGPIGRSPRSIPVTYVKAFDEIRAVFAEALEARTHNYTTSHFSFNVEGGRCETCQGDGYLEVDMQFLADVFMKCPDCHGRRYREEILHVTHRGKNIADVLEMTVREAFGFFRGRKKVQTRLKRLMDVGLDYLRLGQPANTLSGGEAQRLKLAGHLSATSRGRTLFLLDEPTTGLHFADIVQLLDCFEALLAVGHSLIVVEHNLHLIRAADYVIDLGPGAAGEGGRVVATGTPEDVARSPDSITGRYLAEALATICN
jgi:excinuclease ABC subunit A